MPTTATRSMLLVCALIAISATTNADERVLNWVKVTDKARWQARDSSGEVVFRDQLWILGGWFESFAAPPRDVWYTKDGKTWKELKSDVCWKERHEHSTYVFQDKIWVAGGHAQPLSSEVWSLEVPKDWFSE